MSVKPRGTAKYPHEAGMNGTFYAKAIGGCPVCKTALLEPYPEHESKVVTCPHCEEVLQWIREDREASK